MDKLTNSQRRLVFERLFRSGIRSAPQIMRAAGISRSTYYNYKHKLLHGEDLSPKPLKRTPRKFTAQVRRSIGQLAKHPEISSAELASKLEVRFETSFSSSGVRKVLQSMGHQDRVVKPRRLTPQNGQQRLGNAQHNIRTVNLWKRRHWTP